MGYHDNLVPIKGADTYEISIGIVYIATEICELGSIKDYLRKFPKIDDEKIDSQLPQSCIEFTLHVQFPEMVQSFEIALGMEYLAENNGIHADLAARNVLLTSKNCKDPRIWIVSSSIRVHKLCKEATRTIAVEMDGY